MIAWVVVCDDCAATPIKEWRIDRAKCRRFEFSDDPQKIATAYADAAHTGEGSGTRGRRAE
jgi:hypothetical protein